LTNFMLIQMTASLEVQTPGKKQVPGNPISVDSTITMPINILPNFPFGMMGTRCFPQINDGVFSLPYLQPGGFLRNLSSKKLFLLLMNSSSGHHTVLQEMI